MNANQGRLNIERATLFDEFGKCIKCLDFGWHNIQERRSEYIHALNVTERHFPCFHVILVLPNKGIKKSD